MAGDPEAIFKRLRAGLKFKALTKAPQAQEILHPSASASQASVPKNMDFFASEESPEEAPSSPLRKGKKRRSRTTVEEGDLAGKARRTVPEEESFEEPEGDTETQVRSTNLNLPDLRSWRSASLEIKSLRKQLKIKILGDEVPDPVVTWDEFYAKFDVPQYIRKNIAESRYVAPSAIQMQALPIALADREMLAIAPTGSGKTLTFILPILLSLKQPSDEGFRAIVLSPTRELAKQTYREFVRLSQGRKFRIHVLTKATASANSFGPQTTHRFDILVSTPDRLLALIKENAIEMKRVQHLVLDEADKLFELGLVEAVDEIIATCQTSETGDKLMRSLFSATLPPSVEELARTILRNPVRVLVGARNAATETIKQRLMFVGKEEGKLFTLRQLFKEGIPPPALVFVQSKERARDLYRELRYDGVRVDYLSAERTPGQRDRIITNFRTGDIWVLIATDVLARGMDFKGVKCVINYDFPTSVAQYIHRIGRTGRAGNTGEAITFYTESDIELLRAIANVVRNSGGEAADWMLRATPKLTQRRKKQLAHSQIDRQRISTLPHHQKQRRKRATSTEADAKADAAASE